MRASPNRGSCRRTRRREVDTVLLADGINADQMQLVMLQPPRRGRVSRSRVAAQDIQRQCVHLWSALCPSDTHARFVDESQSFRRAVRGFYDTRGKVAFRAFDRGEARDQVGATAISMVLWAVKIEPLSDSPAPAAALGSRQEGP